MKVTLVTDTWLYVDWQVMLFGNYVYFWALASGLKIRLRIPIMLIALNIHHIKGFLSIIYLCESQSCKSWRKEEGIKTLERRSNSNSLLLLLSHFSRVWVWDPIDGSPPGFSIPGILQARILEWVAISFSDACMHAKSLQSSPTRCHPMDSSPAGSSVLSVLSSGLPFPSPQIVCRWRETLQL